MASFLEKQLRSLSSRLPDSSQGVFSKVQNRADRFPNEGVRYTTDAGEETWFPFQGHRSAHPSDKGALRYVAEEDGLVNIWSSELSVNNVLGFSLFRGLCWITSRRTTLGATAIPFVA